MSSGSTVWGPTCSAVRLRHVNRHRGKRQMQQAPAVCLRPGGWVEAAMQLIPLHQLETQMDPALQPPFAAHRGHRVHNVEYGKKRCKKLQEPHAHPFTFWFQGESEQILVYFSSRPFPDVCYSLVPLGCCLFTGYFFASHLTCFLWSLIFEQDFILQHPKWGEKFKQTIKNTLVWWVFFCSCLFLCEISLFL